MTRVETVFELATPLDDAARMRLAEAHSIYGIFRIRTESESRIAVEYDATRLRAPDVRGVLARGGIRTK